jgi:hypothetical protein
MNTVNQELRPPLTREGFIPPEIMSHTIYAYARDFVATHVPGTSRESGVLRQSLLDQGYSNGVVMRSIRRRYFGRSIKQNVREAIRRVQDGTPLSPDDPMSAALMASPRQSERRQGSKPRVRTPRPPTVSAVGREQAAVFWTALRGGQTGRTASAEDVVAALPIESIANATVTADDPDVKKTAVLPAATDVPRKSAMQQDAADQHAEQVEVFVAPIPRKPEKPAMTNAARKKAKKGIKKMRDPLRSTTPKEKRI